MRISDDCGSQRGKTSGKQSGIISWSKCQLTLMVDSQKTRYFLLLAFVAMTAGGPALHHAPIFGLHPCDHQHEGHGHDGDHHARRANRAVVDNQTGTPDSETSDSETSDSCDCGSDHGNAGNRSGLNGLAYSPTANLTGIETKSSDHACDGTCSVCQFFSSISFHAAVHVSAAFDELSYSISFAASVTQSHAVKHSYFERGPPAFFPIS